MQQIISQIINQLKQQNFSRVVSLCKQALTQQNHPQIQLFLAIALGETGQIGQSRSIFQKLSTHLPNNPDVYFNFAIVLEKNNLVHEAIENYSKCIDINPNHLAALRNLAFLYFVTQNFNQTIDTTQKYLTLDKANAEILNLQGLCYIELKQAKSAIPPLIIAKQLNSNNIEYLYNLASAYAMTAETDKLEELLNQLLDFDTLDAYIFVATIYEQSNLIDKALVVIETGLKLHLQHPQLLLLKVKIEKQQKQYQQALNTAEEALSHQNNDFKTELLYEKANLLDRLKQFEPAWGTAQKANNLSFLNWQKTNPKQDKYIQICNLMSNTLVDLEPQTIKPNPNKAGDNLIFVFGFTRSGTTLIDSILSAHSQVTVLEELPLLTGLFNQIPNNSPRQHFKEIISLSETQKSTFRQKYYNEITNFQSWNEQGILVDKSPLNSSIVAFAKTIFPNSKIIFSVRHPLDACISCFFQQFKANSYMTNMITIESIAKTYDAMLSVWKQSLEKFDIKVHYQRYEELVSDFETQTKSLVSYSQLDWQPQMLEYQKTLKTRGVVENPSYNQVNQPIYTSAKNRYKNYLPYLDQAIEILTPWFDFFDYEV